MKTEIKQLKSLVRNIVDPSRDLGHVDRALGKGHTGAESTPAAAIIKVTTAPNDTTSAKTVATDVNTPAGMGASGSREEGKEGKDEGEQQKTCEDCQ